MLVKLSGGHAYASMLKILREAFSHFKDFCRLKSTMIYGPFCGIVDHA